MKRAALVAALLAARVAAADPPAPSPAADPQPATPLDSDSWFGKRASAIAVGGVYASFATWAYFAWFHGAHTMPFSVDTKWADENFFAEHSYAGGADKFGHIWANYVLVRGTTELLVAGGWRRVPASLVAGALDVAAFTASELKDGFIWGFEAGDEVANVLGAALAVVMSDIPVVDRLFDFRLSYWPSADMVTLVKNKFLSRGDGLDVSQDYTGQSYMLALHLRELPYVAERPELYWARYTDLVAGFESRYYEPTPMPRLFPPRQDFYLGVTLDMQAVLEALLPQSRGRRIGKGAFEVLQLPYTTVRFAEMTRTWEAYAGQNVPE